ncbi:MAG: flagellar basal body rod protein FlgB [Spirochaetaceae bacterium]|nr:MAG: flagellar basal body rod protein FlgB [Spirochaetaceae bacterium]
MFTNNSWGRNLDVLQRTMDVSMLRQNVIANNIANADTPGFKRSFVNFESGLRRAIESENRPRSFNESLTNERHIAFERPTDYRSVRPRRILDWETMARNNGNNVDIEVESMNMLNNMLSYQLMAQNVGEHFNRLNIVLG